MTAIADEPRTPLRTLGRTNALVVVAAAFVVLVALLGYRATLAGHEVYAAQPAREMLDGGSLVLQPFAGVPRVKKPPGQSWLIALSLAATGAQNEYTARLPSAIAAAGLALVIGAVGARLASRRVGLIAALMTLTAHGVQDRARLAEADMALALAIAGCYAATLWAPRAPARALAPACLFWLAVVAGIFLKGPILLGFVLPPLAIAYVILRARGDRDAATAIRRTALHPLPLIVAALVVAAWVAAALRLQPGIVEAWRHEVVDRASGEMRRDSPLKYLGLYPLAAMPWFPFAIVALVVTRGTWRAALRRPDVLLLTTWAAFGLAMISCVALKALHYALPILPPLILLSAVGFERMLARALAARPPERRAIASRALIATWFGVAGVAWLVNQAVVEPRKGRGAAVTAFAAEVERLVPVDKPIYFVGVGEERTAWYLRRRLVQAARLGDDALGAQLARLPPRALVLCRLPDEARIAATGRTVEPLARSADYRGRGEAFERRSLVRVSDTAPSPQ